MLTILSRTIFRFSKNNFIEAAEPSRDKKPTRQGLILFPAKRYCFDVMA
jgi:hypothetical protein